MTIYYATTSAARTNVIPLSSNNGRPTMIPIWRRGDTKAIYPLNAQHIFKFDHATFSNPLYMNCRCSSSTNGGITTAGGVFTINSRWSFKTSAGTTSTVPAEGWSGIYATNPIFYKDFDSTSSRNFFNYAVPYIPTEVWNVGRRLYGDSSAASDIFDYTDHRARRTAVIWPNYFEPMFDRRGPNYWGVLSALTSIPASACPAGMVYGITLALGEKNLWPGTATTATFGTIIGVPTANSAHSITTIYKSGRKSSFSEWNWRSVSSTITAIPGGTSYAKKFSYGKYFNDDNQTTLCKYVTDTSIKNITGFVEGTKFLMQSSTYKYLLLTAGATFTSATTDLVTPAFIAYSGNKSGVVTKPYYVDSWISFRF